MNIIPYACRQPDRYARYIQLLYHRRRHWCNDHLASEIVLVFYLISFCFFRVLIVHRQHERQSVFIASVVHRIQIRHHPVTLPERFPHRKLRILFKPPRLLAVKFAGRAVQPQNRRICPKLRPPRSHLVVFIPKHMPADIVAPPAISDIGRGRCKVRLKIQRIPGHQRIPGKSSRIAVASWPCVSGKRQRALSIPPVVQIVKMVQYPQRVKPFDLAVAALLPVNPPKIDAFFFSWMVQIFKICFQIFRIGKVAEHWIFVFIIYPHRLCHILIHFLICLHAVRRMDIQRHVHPPLMQPCQKPRRIWKQLFVPRISRPAAAVFRVNIYKMPVHIDYCYRKRQVFFVKPLHQLHICLLGIFIVTAPPVSKRKPWQHRRRSAQRVKIVQRLFVIMSVSKEIQVPDPFFPSVLQKDLRLAVVNNRITKAGDHAML